MRASLTSWRAAETKVRIRKAYMMATALATYRRTRFSHTTWPLSTGSSLATCPSRTRRGTSSTTSMIRRAMARTEKHRSSSPDTAVLIPRRTREGIVWRRPA
jgi:hypothetical protein